MSLVGSWGTNLERRRTLGYVPEGDTIHYAANRIRPVLEGQVPDELRTPHPRFGRDRWPERLAGRAVRAVEARGKHLLLRFEGGLAIHSHLRMTGSWQVLSASAPRWHRPPRRAWLTIRKDDDLIVQFDGPVLELMTDGRTRSDRRIAGLGPDIVAEGFDEARVLRRLREDDPTRTIGDALLDQRTVAGIGNLWKVEGCWLAGIDPWRQAGTVTDDEILAILRAVRPRMQQSARDGMQNRWRTIYNAAGRPCPRCGTLVRSAAQGDDNRLTWWCPGCQT
jgi:endonuclease-8